MGLLSKANKYNFNRFEDPLFEIKNKDQTKGIKVYEANKYFKNKCSVIDRIKNDDRYERILIKDKILDRYFYDNSKFVHNLPTWKNEHPKNKIVGVLFSNGLDSTYKVIEEVLKGNCIIPIINIFNEDYNIFNISCYTIEKLSKLYPNQIFKPVMIMNSSFNENVNFIDSYKFTQQFLNPYSVSLIDYNILKYIEEVHYGLVLEDQGVSFLNEIKDVYKLGFKFNYDYITKHNTKIPILKFDLIKKLKTILYEEYQDIFRKLPIISCQNPDISYYINKDETELIICVEVCNDCHSCLINKQLNIPLTHFTIKVDIRDRVFRWEYYYKNLKAKGLD